MDEIDLQTRTLYAELFEQMQVLDASRTISSLAGTFSYKKINEEEYVYFRHYRPDGHLAEIYVGKRDDNTEQLVADYNRGKPGMLEMRQNIRRLSMQVQAGLDIPINKPVVRVIRALADAGLFRNGGVLVGTHAYQAIGVRIGVRWPAKSMTTNDIDIAASPRISVAVPMVKTDIPAVIDSLEMGFFPVPSLNHKHPSTTFAIRNKRLRLDIITPKTTASDAPVFIPRFSCAATPLPYLSYLIEAPVQALVIDTDPVLVNVPQPARYAFHKLVISQVRDIAKDEKAAKDLLQAYQLLSAIQELRPADIKPAWQDLLSRGPKWKKYAQAGLTKIENRYGKIEI
jgi:hypothetical protein